MNKTSTIQKQVIAFLLAGVFLFIHAGKFLHTHDSLIATEKAVHSSQVVKAADCPVCDFQVAKESGSEPIVFEEHHATFSSPHHALLQSRTITSIGLSYADRGPPALL